MPENGGESSMSGFSNIVIKTLYDADGNVTGHAAGTAAELANLATAGWSGTGSVADPADVFRAVCRQYLIDARKAAEAGGVAIGGNVYYTDTDSLVKCLGALAVFTVIPAATGQPAPATVSWMTANNGFVELDQAGVVAMCVAVVQHVQACFEWAHGIAARLDAATTVEAMQAISFAGRPDCPAI